MSARRNCLHSIAVPPWVAASIVFALLAATGIVILGLYLWREKRRAKSFYGKVLEFSTLEQAAPDYKKKEELESLVFGGQQNDVLVVNDPHNTPNGASGVKILMRKRIRKQTPNNPYGTNAFTPAETSIVAWGATPTEIVFTVVIDRLGRAMELLDCLKLVPPPTDNHMKMAEHICSEIRDRLQTMTGRRYTVYGLVNEHICIVKGHEHLFVDLGSTILQMKLVVKKPLHLSIVAHEITVVLDKLDVSMMATTARSAATTKLKEEEPNMVDNTPTYFSAPQKSIVKKSTAGSNRNAQTPAGSNRNAQTPAQRTPAAIIVAVATPTPKAKTNKTSKKSSKLKPTKTELLPSSSQHSTPNQSILTMTNNDFSPSPGVSPDIVVQQLEMPEVIRPAVSLSSNGPKRIATRKSDPLQKTSTRRSRSPLRGLRTSGRKSDPQPVPQEKTNGDPPQKTSTRRSGSPLRALRTAGKKSDPPISQEKTKGYKSDASPLPRLPTGSRAVLSNKRSNMAETPR